MSIKVMTKVWEYYPNGGSELLALLALADWSDDNGKCYPSIAAVAKKIRLKDRQAKRLLHELIDAGYVSVIGNEFGGAPGSSRQYQINLSSLTGVLGDTPLAETGVMVDIDGCHPRPKRGVLGDTLYVIEPSIEPSDKPEKKFSGNSSQKISLKTFLEKCKEENQKPLPEDDPVFSLAQKIGINDGLLEVCWKEFKVRYLENSSKKYKDWRAAFRNAVKGNYYKAWAFDAQGNVIITSQGRQLAKVHDVEIN